uniref:Uncharacterized protein n=1 Tax=Anguilla anguilla TaxID=7936 RepID=A0A0E9Y0Q8_ANGAN
MSKEYFTCICHYYINNRQLCVHLPLQYCDMEELYKKCIRTKNYNILCK